MTVRLRPKTAADVPALFEIWKAAVRATHAFLSETDFAEYCVQLEQLYLPLAELEVVELDGEVVGFLGMSQSKVDSLFLAPACHGRGVGRAVMDVVFARYPQVTLDVNEQNQGARAFYERLGFRQTGRSDVDDSGKPYPILHLARG